MANEIKTDTEKKWAEAGLAAQRVVARLEESKNEWKAAKLELHHSGAAVSASAGWPEVLAERGAAAAAKDWAEAAAIWSALALAAAGEVKAAAVGGWKCNAAEVNERVGRARRMLEEASAHSETVAEL